MPMTGRQPLDEIDLKILSELQRDGRIRNNELAVKVGTIRCNGCGAPVDIRKDHACTHCRSPITILDPAAVEQALARYQQAEVKRTTVDVDALGDAIVMREREKSRYQREKRQGRIEDIDVGDLLISGVELAWKYFRH